MQEHEYIIVGGFGGSGSSALIDMFNEVENMWVYDGEFRLITDPDGLISLENALIEDWTPYKSDISIKRFRQLIKNLNNQKGFPYYKYFKHKKVFNNRFIEITEDYLNSIITFSYKGMWVGINNFMFFLGRKINSKLRMDLLNFNKTIYLSSPVQDFYTKTKKYLSNLIDEAADQRKFCVLDEGYISLQLDKAINYFDDPKFIIVDRDPRDLYINAIKANFKFIPKEINSYINWYKFIHLKNNSMKISKKNLLQINFEDLVLDYQRSRDLIFDFIKVSKSNHKRFQQYFVPAISKKNIGLWKEYRTKEIEMIEKSLKEYCYTKILK